MLFIRVISITTDKNGTWFSKSNENYFSYKGQNHTLFSQSNGKANKFEYNFSSFFRYMNHVKNQMIIL
jgi:hypothetical protein